MRRAAVEPLRADVADVVDQARARAQRLGDLAEPVRVRAVRRAQHQHQIHVVGELLDGGLAVLGRVADVVARRPEDGREPATEDLDHRPRVVHRQRGLREVGDLLGVLDDQLLRLLDRVDDDDAAGRLAQGPDHLVVVRVADEDDRAPLLRVPDRLEVDLGDERARRVDHPEPPVRRGIPHRRRDPVRAEDHRRALGHLVQLVHEDGALLPKRLDHVAVVDDLAPHVDRHAHDLEGLLDDLDGPLDARAEASRARQDDLGQRRRGARSGRRLGVSDSHRPQYRGRRPADASNARPRAGRHRKK